MDDTEVPWILWVQCVTSTECKTIRISVSTVKDGWAVLLKLRPEFSTVCVCVLIKLLGSSQRTWHNWVGLVPTLFMLISVTCPHGYLKSLDACLTKLLNMSLHSKLAFCKNLPISCIVVSWTKTWVACEYIQSTHWLATGYFIGQAWKNMMWWRTLQWQTCELGRFPVRMPVGLRQMAWVQVIDEDFRCEVILEARP